MREALMIAAEKGIRKNYCMICAARDNKVTEMQRPPRIFVDAFDYQAGDDGEPTLQHGEESTLATMLEKVHGEELTRLAVEIAGNKEMYGAGVWAVCAACH